MESRDPRLHAIELNLQQGQARAALEACRAILRNDPNFGQVLALTGLAYTLMGDEIEARSALARALEVAPLDPRVRQYAYMGFQRLNDVLGARSQLTYLCQLERENVPAKSLLARLGGPVIGLPPLPRATSSAVWYDGGGHATMDSAEFDALDEEGEPPPGPDVVECEECRKRTFKGWVCKFCGARLALPALAGARYA